MSDLAKTKLFVVILLGLILGIGFASGLLRDSVAAAEAARPPAGTIIGNAGSVPVYRVLDLEEGVACYVSAGSMAGSDIACVLLPEVP